MTQKSRSEIRHIVLGPLIGWVALCGLLAATIVLAYVPLGVLNLPVSLTIAVLKTAIIALVFMELIRASNIQRLASAAGMFWLSFLFILLFADYLSR